MKARTIAVLAGVTAAAVLIYRNRDLLLAQGIAWAWKDSFNDDPAIGVAPRPASPLPTGWPHTHVADDVTDAATQVLPVVKLHRDCYDSSMGGVSDADEWKT